MPFREHVDGAHSAEGIRPDGEKTRSRLRSGGSFKGSGQRYELPSETHWAIVGFQKSTSSDQDRVKFTINVMVVDRDEWGAGAGGASLSGGTAASMTVDGLPFVQDADQYRVELIERA